MLRRVVGAAWHKARALLTQRMAERLSAPMRDRLDELVAVGDDQPHSSLHGIKTGTSSPSVGGMKRLLARLELSVIARTPRADSPGKRGSADRRRVWGRVCAEPAAERGGEGGPLRPDKRWPGSYSLDRCGRFR